jgi:hypothetical protein
MEKTLPNKNLLKIPFDTEEEARAELERIISGQHKPWLKRNTKPCRYYKDPKLGKWFLTSQITISTY